MNLNDWSFCSQEDDTISLHDCVMDHVEWENGGLWLVFEEGFYVTNANFLNPTGRSRITGKAAVFLKAGSYLEGAWNRNCTWQASAHSEPILLKEIPIHPEQFTDWSPEVLDFTWEVTRRRFLSTQSTVLGIVRSTSPVRSCGSAGMSCRSRANTTKLM